MTNFKTLILYMEYLHPLEEGSEINNHSFTIGMPFDTPRPSKVYKSIPEESLRGFYNGEKYSIDTKLNYRIDKLMQASLKLGVDKILLPKPQKSVNLFLISPKIDFTFFRLCEHLKQMILIYHL